MQTLMYINFSGALSLRDAFVAATMLKTTQRPFDPHHVAAGQSMYKESAGILRQDRGCS
jgi:hypothetical protein